MNAPIALSPAQRQRRRDREARRPDRTRLDLWPRDPLLKWALRLGLAIPFLVVALLDSAGTTNNLATPNQQLLEHIATIDWNRADVNWIGDIFPPLSTLLAAAIPGGRAGLAVAGALLAGVFLQKMIEIMVQRRFSVVTIVILIVALGANPLFAYTATENFAAFLGLAFFGIGISDIVRFVAWGNTQSGFRAGLYLMLATLSDLSGLIYVLTSAVAAPFLRLGRQGETGARGANVLVIVYPTVAALSALMLLNWVFTGNPIGQIGLALTEGVNERFAGLAFLFATANGWFLIAPVVCAWIIALIVRRPGSILVSSLVSVAILAGFVIGLFPTGSAGNTFILMTLMAIALVPTAKSPLTRRLIDVVAIAQIVIAWGGALNRQAVLDWMNALVAAIPYVTL